ncbi:hypothetical protein BCR39DRAFT_516789 [Naematelia encephala]|uniref:TPR-like protein n=1 Tax=Naematelia encephala TaxID=71784 RepID=A0A1Y2BHE8_9TREE|nr:hypothetical protein BCR39DRAFT_516789 [Naematelia encephala]
MGEKTTDFDSLHFDPDDLKPPSWAAGPQFQWAHDKPGEGSKAASSGFKDREPTPLDLSDDEDEEDEEDQVFEDARDDMGADEVEEINGMVTFTVPEMRVLLSKAISFKETGNAAFTTKPPNLDLAIESYQSALKCLPEVPKLAESQPPREPTREAGSGIEEVTDEEAKQIERDEEARRMGEQPDERKDLEADIRECAKACWGNLAACWIAKNDDAEAVKACTEALKLDPTYVKAIQRRASANDRISTWSSLSSARDDYNLLLTLLPPTSTQIPIIRRSLASLTPRLKLQEDKEKDEMMSKLKDLGNSLLGNFGLSTNNFKFDPQPGGGYSMRFEQ